jgi:hypothetical protein
MGPPEPPLSGWCGWRPFAERLLYIDVEYPDLWRIKYIENLRVTWDFSTQLMVESQYGLAGGRNESPID